MWWTVAGGWVFKGAPGQLAFCLHELQMPPLPKWQDTARPQVPPTGVSPAASLPWCPLANSPPPHPRLASCAQDSVLVFIQLRTRVGEGVLETEPSYPSVCVLSRRDPEAGRPGQVGDRRGGVGGGVRRAWQGPGVLFQRRVQLIAHQRYTVQITSTPAGPPPAGREATSPAPPSEGPATPRFTKKSPRPAPARQGVHDPPTSTDPLLGSSVQDPWAAAGVSTTDGGGGGPAGLGRPEHRRTFQMPTGHGCDAGFHLMCLSP